MHREHSAPRRVFVDVRDPATFAADLRRREGSFVPTRLTLRLGDTFVLAMRVPGIIRPIEAQVCVVGRRAARGARGPLSAGVMAQLVNPGDPALDLLLGLGSGEVVDLDSRVAQSRRRPAVCDLPSRDELVATAEQLSAGEVVLVPLEEPVKIGERLRLHARIPSGEHIVVDVEVRGVVRRDDERAARVALFGDDSRAALQEWLARAPTLVHKLSSSAS